MAVIDARGTVLRLACREELCAPPKPVKPLRFFLFFDLAQLYCLRALSGRQRRNACF